MGDQSGHDVQETHDGVDVLRRGHRKHTSVDEVAWPSELLRLVAEDDSPIGDEPALAGHHVATADASDLRAGLAEALSAIADLCEQSQSLRDRVDALVDDNAALRAENQDLHARLERLVRRIDRVRRDVGYGDGGEASRRISELCFKVSLGSGADDVVGDDVVADDGAIDGWDDVDGIERAPQDQSVA